MVEMVMLSVQVVSTKQSSYLYDLILSFQRYSRNKGCVYSAQICVLKLLLHPIYDWNK